MSGLLTMKLGRTPPPPPEPPEPGPDHPVMGPGSGWNGFVGTGGGAPADVNRVVGKPAARWITPDYQRFSGSDLVVGIDADSKYGINRIEWYLEGSVATVEGGPKRYVDTTVNGRPRTRGGYFVSLDWSALMAQQATPNHLNNGVRLYAKVYSNDPPTGPAFEPRVIGPRTFFPEATTHDVISAVDWGAKTISLPGGGGDYTSIKAAFAAVRAANCKSAKLTIIQTGFYEWEDSDSASSYANARGYTVLTAAEGVTATIGRARFPYDEADPDWLPGDEDRNWSINDLMGPLELRGKGIVLDHRNFTLIERTDLVRNVWLNGIKITTSEGTPYSWYWNRRYKPQGLLSSAGNTYRGVIEDCVMEFENGVSTMNLEICRGNRYHDIVERFWNGSYYTADNYADGNDVSWFRQSVNVMTLTQIAPGTMTIGKTSGDSFSIKLDGEHLPGSPFQLGDRPNDDLWLVSQTIAHINATFAGYVVAAPIGTEAEYDARAARYITRVGSLDGFSATLTFGAAYTLRVFTDIHSGGGNYQTGINENIIWRRNTTPNIDGLSDQSNFTFLLFDVGADMRDCIWDGLAAQGANGSAGMKGDSQGTPPSMKHCVFKNMSLGFKLGFTSLVDEHCVFGGSAMFEIRTAGNLDLRDNMDALEIVGGSDFAAAAALYATWLEDAQGGDFRPIGPLVDPDNLIARVDEFDSRYLDRPALDAVGAFAISAVEPEYDFEL